MDGQVKLFIWTGVVVAIVVGAILQMWPYRRFREIVIQRRIAASREHIWDCYVTDLDNPLSAAFHDTLVSSRTVSTDPQITEYVCDASDRNGTHHSSTQLETLVSERPERVAVRCIDVDGQPPPSGEDNVEEMRLTETPDGTVATMTWRGETETLGQYRTRRNRFNQYMDSLKTFCETGRGTSVPQSSRSPWRSLALTALAVGSFTYLFGLVFALILSVAIVIHEFGHWIAMRISGQPRPRIMLVPFFGGVAVPNHPYKTQFDGALVALAGPGLSLLPCLALLGGAMALGLPEMAKSAKVAMQVQAQMPNGSSLLALALIVALLNALQLLPVLPLDGGHVLRSLIESTGARRARPILLGLAAAGIVSFGLLGDYILAAVLALGAMQAWHLGEGGQTARPMGGATLAIIGVSYALVLGIHAGTAVYAMRMLGIDLV